MNFSENIWGLILISFSAYFIISMVMNKLRVQNFQQALDSVNGLHLLNLKHFLGILFFGILTYSFAIDFRYLILDLNVVRIHVLLLFFVTVFLAAYVSHSSAIKTVTSHINPRFQHLSDIGSYFLLRITFLLCYEFFFRGVLLFVLLNNMGLPTAIFYNTAFYLLIHIFDSKKEILGTIPFGIILCLFSYFTESIWYPFIIHLALSLVYETSIFYRSTFNKNIKS